MSELSDETKIKKNITQIAIPGSHDCGTCHLNKSWPVGPDEPDILQDLGNNPILGPILVRPIMLRWSVTQHSTVYDQLMTGVRYFDFRIAKLLGVYRMVHGLYGDAIFDVLDNIKLFLDEHNKEIVILDFQAVFDCSNDDHLAIIGRLQSLFGSRLLEKSGQLPTIHEMQEANQQVIVIYGGYMEFPFLWPRNFCPNPWANTMTVSTLFKFLLKHLSKKPKNCLFVTQAILTPQTKTILLKPFSTLFKATKTCRESLPSWIEDEASKLNPNIIMTDFVSDTKITSLIVSLN